MPQPKTQFGRTMDMANEALHQHEWESLRLHAQMMRRLEPQDETAWSYLGIANYNIGLQTNHREQMLEGIAQVENATRLNPNSSMAWNNHAIVLMKEDQYEAGLVAAKSAVGLDKLGIGVLRSQMVAELNLGLLDDAESTYREIRKRDKNDSGLVVPLTWITSNQGRRQLSRTLSVSVTLDEDGFQIEENDFDGAGGGETLRQAMTNYGDDLEMLIEEYVETDDPLDEGAKEMAERLRSHL